MLSEEQRRQLTDRVWDEMGVPISPAVLRRLLGAELARDIPIASPYSAADWVVKTALAQPTPDTLLQLVREADPAGRRPEVHALAARLKADPSLWVVRRGDPLWLLDRRPFVDRTELRRLLSDTRRSASRPPPSDDPR